jgi:2-polyprenyl-3-methyl-5-hydroxy-6-metoxy-1,4-benzoquinol methylase
MTKEPSHNIDNYNEKAKSLTLSYNSVSTADILPQFAAAVPLYAAEKLHRVLDIGCGSGRDAFWLAEQGFHVTAVEAASEMLIEATKHFPHARITYLLDSAPEMTETRRLGQKFDIILMSAFLFHIDESERAILYARLQELMAETCVIHLTLRHGPAPEGRTMFAIPLSELEAFAKAQGLACTIGTETPDALKRPDVTWQEVSLKRPCKLTP